MRKAMRVALLAAALIVLASVLALQAGARSQSDGNRLEATFTTSIASLTNRAADLGVVQVIVTGTGTVEGYGDATEVVGLTQDRSVTPCGAGSYSDSALRRMTVEGGVLVLWEAGMTCPTASGLQATATYEVDGSSSTGIFAGAGGSGIVTVDTVSHTETLSGKLKLADPGA